MFLSRLSKRERYLLYITVVVLVSILFGKAGVSPIMQRLSKLNREIFVQEKKLEKSLRVLAREELIRSEYKKYIQFVRQSRSDEEQTSELLSEIEKLADKTSISLSNIKPGKIEKVGRYRKYVVRIEAESEIGHLASFIYQLEESPELLRIRNFHLTPRKKASSILKARMTITELLIVK